MVNLVIDIGNTFFKLAVFENDNIISFSKSQQVDDALINNLIEKYSIENTIVSSVKELPKSDFIENYDDLTYIVFNHQTKIPINNNYGTPDTLGLDRLAAVIGAKKLYPENPVLVIDAGTCITFDFIDESSQYLGGSISPGKNMRFLAMNNFTKKLPLVELESDSTFNEFIGTNTIEALQSGVVNGILFEIEGYIKRYEEKYSSLKIIICGGDASFFDTRLKNSIFAHQILLEPQLVLIGLNTVVNYQND